MRYVLHVGPPKTGSTSIQAFLTLNRDRLLEDGVLYAANASEGIFPQHSGLPRMLKRDRQGLRDFLAGVRAEAEAAQAHTVVLSGEFLSHLPRKRAVAFAEELREHGGADAFTVIYYARNVVARLLSRVSQHLKQSTVGVDDAGLVEVLEAMGSPTEQIAAMEKGFGAANVHVRSYDAAAGGLERDFVAAAGLPWRDDYVLPPPYNISLDPLAARLFSMLDAEFHLPARVTQDVYNRPGRMTLPRLEQRYIDLVVPLAEATDLSHPKLQPFREVLTALPEPDEAARPSLPEYLGYLHDLLQTARAAAAEDPSRPPSGR